MSATSTRTKSGRAGNDCHNCVSAKRQCDRRWPWCRTCQEQEGVRCQGYPISLTWNVGVASRGKLRGRKIPVHDEKAKRKCSELTTNLRSPKRQSVSSTSSLMSMDSELSSPISDSMVVVTTGENMVVESPFFEDLFDITFDDLSPSSQIQNPFELSPLPSIPSPGPSSQKRLLRYCILSVKLC